MRNPGARRAAAVSGACGAAALLASGVCAPPANAGADDPVAFGITVDGSYASVRFDFGGQRLPILGDIAEAEGSADIGVVEVDAAHSHAFGSLVGGSALGTELPVHLYSTGQVDVAEGAASESVGVRALRVPGLGSLRSISAEAAADRDDEILGHGSPGGELTTLRAEFDGLDLVDLDDLNLLDGPLGNLVRFDLPVSGPLFDVGAGRLTQETGVYAKEDGSQGAYVEFQAWFGDLDLLGGAAEGGVTVAASRPDGADDAGEPDVSGRLEASGDPGGASFEYELPALELRTGDGGAGIAIEPGFDETIEVAPGVEVDIRLDGYGEDDVVLAGDGTRARASGSGLTARVTFDVPVPVVGEIEVGSAEIVLLGFPASSVEVPPGGLHATGGDGLP